MRAIVRAIDRLSGLFGALAALIVVVLVVLMLYDVLMRYAFNAPTTWGNDLNTFLMGGSFLLSIAYALATDSHVRVDLLYGEKSRHQLKYVDLVGFALIVLPAAAWITWGLWGHFQEALRTGERTGSGGWNPVVWPFKAVMFFGFAIFTLQIAAEIIKRLYAIFGSPIIQDQADEHAG
jgi:TRAP-type mannitol/chloroaromatic compound transport system permease small subunit